MRNSYWSCSEFADWLRGTDKIGAGTSEEWAEWERTSRARHPIRYWIAEEGLDKLQNIIHWPTDRLYDLKYYINNRWVTRTHSLTANKRDIRPGQWRDVGDRFLPCLFNELQDFVEIELAWWHIAWADKDERAKYNAPFWATGWFRWRTWRCPQAGIDNLDWQRKLRWTEDQVGPDSPELGKLTPQALKAQEILDLYKWWTETYRNRPDPMDASGWTEYCEASRKINGDGWLGLDPRDPKLKEQGDEAHKRLDKIEADYEREDEDMMIRLIKVRHGLWT